jgi:hypothetical protein
MKVNGKDYPIYYGKSKMCVTTNQIVYPCAPYYTWWGRKAIPIYRMGPISHFPPASLWYPQAYIKHPKMSPHKLPGPIFIPKVVSYLQLYPTLSIFIVILLVIFL